MGSFSIWHWVIVLAVVLILFGGKGKIPSLMGDFAKGIKSFKSGLKEEDKAVGDDDASDPKAAVTAEAVAAEPVAAEPVAAEPAAAKSVAEEPVKQENSAKG